MKRTKESLLEMKDFVRVMRINGLLLVQPLGWYAIEGNQAVWYKPADDSPKTVDSYIDTEAEPAIEKMNIDALMKRIDEFRADGMKVLDGQITERTPVGTYVIF